MGNYTSKRAYLAFADFLTLLYSDEYKDLLFDLDCDDPKIFNFAFPSFKHCLGDLDITPSGCVMYREFTLDQISNPNFTYSTEDAVYTISGDLYELSRDEWGSVFKSILHRVRKLETYWDFLEEENEGISTNSD